MSYLADQTKGKSQDFCDGFKLGIISFAWWKDGVQYVGTSGGTLKEAMNEIQQQQMEDAGTAARDVFSDEA